MGADVKMYFRWKPGKRVDLWVMDGFQLIAGDYAHGATHQLDSSYRYYGKDYERGPWPIICAQLMVLFADEDVEAVWYFADETDIEGTEEPTTKEEVIELCRHFMGMHPASTAG
jgi:hypothetical protein